MFSNHTETQSCDLILSLARHHSHPLVLRCASLVASKASRFIFSVVFLCNVATRRRSAALGSHFSGPTQAHRRPPPPHRDPRRDARHVVRSLPWPVLASMREPDALAMLLVMALMLVGGLFIVWNRSLPEVALHEAEAAVCRFGVEELNASSAAYAYTYSAGGFNVRPAMHAL